METSMPATVGPIGRLGRYTATHVRTVVAVWAVVAIALGFFAPRVETALSGAGWETTGSQSVQPPQLSARSFQALGAYALPTVVRRRTDSSRAPASARGLAGVERRLRAAHAVTGVVAPAAG